MVLANETWLAVLFALWRFEFEPEAESVVLLVRPRAAPPPQLLRQLPFRLCGRLLTALLRVRPGPPPAVLLARLSDLSPPSGALPLLVFGLPPVAFFSLSPNILPRLTDDGVRLSENALALLAGRPPIVPPLPIASSLSSTEPSAREAVDAFAVPPLSFLLRTFLVILNAGEFRLIDDSSVVLLFLREFLSSVAVLSDANGFVRAKRENMPDDVDADDLVEEGMAAALPSMRQGSDSF